MEDIVPFDGGIFELARYGIYHFDRPFRAPMIHKLLRATCGCIGMCVEQFVSTRNRSHERLVEIQKSRAWTEGARPSSLPSSLRQRSRLSGAAKDLAVSGYAMRFARDPSRRW